MAMCEACAAIVRNRRGAPGHDALQKIGERRGAKPVGQARINVVEHVCTQCGTKWEYENDKNDSFVGWSPVH